MRFYSYIAVLLIIASVIGGAFVSSCVEEKAEQEEFSTASVEQKQPEDTEQADASSVQKYRNLVDGSEISLDDMKGRVLIVDFWATWCPPCRREIPGFIELYDKYKDKGVTIVGVSVDRGESVVKRFIEQQKMNYPVIMSTRELQSKYEEAIGQPIRAIPTTIVVDKKGAIASVHVGFRPKEVFEQEIQKLLGGD